MSVGDVLSEAWGLYTRFFWRLVGTAAIVFVATAWRLMYFKRAAG